MGLVIVSVTKELVLHALPLQTSALKSLLASSTNFRNAITPTGQGPVRQLLGFLSSCSDGRMEPISISLKVSAAGEQWRAFSDGLAIQGKQAEWRWFFMFVHFKNRVYSEVCCNRSMIEHNALWTWSMITSHVGPYSKPCKIHEVASTSLLRSCFVFEFCWHLMTTKWSGSLI